MSQPTWNDHASATAIRVAALITSSPADYFLNELPEFAIDCFTDIKNFEAYLLDRSIATLPEVILIEVDSTVNAISVIERMKKNPLLKGLIIIMLAKEKNSQLISEARKLKVHDFYSIPFTKEVLVERIQFLVKFKFIKPTIADLGEGIQVTYQLPWAKRAFDIAFSASLLIVASPLLLVTAALVRLESKGPIIYKSKRVGTGYRIFDFYKFRSMRPDADKMLAKLAAEKNQYAVEEAGATQSAFVKLKDDPRVTKVGNFIRNTSIDELPQLFNILMGDMSTVGNRPLPLYEAEMLTGDEWATRFLGPAGLTGLWQVSKRGKADMSERERKKLDNFYAEKHSFWLDMKILVSTVPALFQKEKV